MSFPTFQKYFLQLWYLSCDIPDTGTLSEVWSVSAVRPSLYVSIGFVRHPMVKATYIQSEQQLSITFCHHQSVNQSQGYYCFIPQLHRAQWQWHLNKDLKTVKWSYTSPHYYQHTITTLWIIDQYTITLCVYIPVSSLYRGTSLQPSDGSYTDICKDLTQYRKQVIFNN